MHQATTPHHPIYQTTRTKPLQASNTPLWHPHSSGTTHHNNNLGRMSKLQPPTKRPSLTDSAVCFSEDSLPELTQENLGALQDQIRAHNLRMALVRTVKYSDNLYPQVLKERGCIYDNGEPPDNLSEVLAALDADRDDDMTEAQAKKLWEKIKAAGNEDKVALIAHAHIVDLISMCDPEGEVWTVTRQAFQNSFPLPVQQNPDDSPFQISAPVPDAAIGHNAEKFANRLAQAYLKAYSIPIKSESNLLFPCFTFEEKGLNHPVYAQYQNVHNAAFMLQSLRKLRECAGMDETDLQRDFDGKVHVMTLSVSKINIELCVCWTRIYKEDGFIKYRSKPIAEINTTSDNKKFIDMVKKIRNGINYVLDTNAKWIKPDLEALQEKIKNEDPVPDINPAASVAGSRERSRNGSSVGS